MASDKLYKLRNGIPPHKNITIRDEEFTVVLLPSDTVRQIEETTNEYASQNPEKVNDSVKSKYFDGLLVYNCLRDPSDTTFRNKIAEKPEDVIQVLDDMEIAKVTEAYGELMMNKAPKVEMITDEELNIIKKHLEVTPLSDLSTVLCVHLANCHQTIVSEN